MIEVSGTLTKAATDTSGRASSFNERFHSFEQFFKWVEQETLNGWCVTIVSVAR